MTNHIDNSEIDKHVDDEIAACLDFKSPKSFFLFAGAGSGKTRSLVGVLEKLRLEHGEYLRLNRQQIAVITYTNAACDEIKSRIEYDKLFFVSTIHSFIWELIRNYNSDIRDWLKTDLANEINELTEQQKKSRGNNKTSIDRGRKIESKSKRLQGLDGIKYFVYNPNGDNITKDSLNHSEVIKIGANFLTEKPLMQKILVQKFPILFIDESQDTKKELIDAFFIVQSNYSQFFSLGLFGDTMQRIYSDGKENLGQSLPANWRTPVKKLNHRCPKRIITLINKIRADVDKQEQIARTDKEEGTVRFFIVSSDSSNKGEIEQYVAVKMASITGDSQWNANSSDVQKLILEHHMAASRMGFIGVFEPLYKTDQLRTGLLDGTLPGVRFFTQLILPLINAKLSGDEFLVARIVRENSPLLRSNILKKSEHQHDIVKKINIDVLELCALWKDNADPRLIDILRKVYLSNLFLIPDSLMIIAQRKEGEQTIVSGKMQDGLEVDEISDSVIEAWDSSLSQSFSQIVAYNEYISGRGKFGTHQGVKGREFPRVMLIIDDEEARGFMFNYEKLFGVEDLSDTDIKNSREGKDSSIDRTRRLFYVACSRAMNSLAIVAYTANPQLLERNVVRNGWFQKEEVEVIP